MLRVYDLQNLFVLIHCDAIGVGRCQLPFRHSPLLQQRKQQKQNKKEKLERRNSSGITGTNQSFFSSALSAKIFADTGKASFKE